MIKLSHDTHRSLCPDENGNCHRLCMDRFSYKDSQNCVTYTGKIYTFAKNKYSDKRHELTCTAKFHCSNGTEEWASGERARAEIVRKSASSFNELVNGTGPRLVFTLPEFACVESVASFSKRRVGEFVLFEDTLSNFTEFVDINGREVKHTSSRRSFRRKSSHRKNPKCTDVQTDSCCCQKQSFELVPSEPAGPAIDMNYLVPTSPPCEDDNPPSYEEIFGPFVNANDQSRTDVGNDIYNLYCMNYFPVEPGVSEHQETCVDTSPCTHSSNNNVSCRGVQPGTHFTPRTHDQTDKLPHPTLRAFIHFDFCQVNGQRVVSNLKGTYHKGDKYTLTTPTFHSLSRNYGKRDKGEAGMRRVIENHVCSRWCGNLPSMQDIFVKALTKSDP